MVDGFRPFFARCLDLSLLGALWSVRALWTPTVPGPILPQRAGLTEHHIDTADAGPTYHIHTADSGSDQPDKNQHVSVRIPALAPISVLHPPLLYLLVAAHFREPIRGGTDATGSAPMANPVSEPLQPPSGAVLLGPGLSPPWRWCRTKPSAA